MVQRDANQLRSMVVDGVVAVIHWEAELVRPLRSAELSYLNEWVFIPSARGASQCDSSNAFITVATKQEFSEPDTQERIILGLRALVRFHYYKTWRFDKADEDFPRYANLIESLRRQAIPWLNSSYHKVDGDPVPALVESLLIGGRMLNILAAHAREDAALIDALFTLPVDRPVEGDSSWAQLRMECFECRNKLVLELLSRIGVRQGAGDKVFGVDAARLLGAIRTLKSTWQIKSQFPTHRSGDESIMRIDAHVKELTRRLQSTISKRRQEIVSQWEIIRGELGNEFEKQEVVNGLSRVLQATRQFGVKDPQDNLGQLTTLVEGFRDAAVSQCLQHVQRIGEETEGGAVLSALAQVDDDTFMLVSRFASECCAFLNRTESRIKGELDTLGEDIVENAIKSLDAELRTIEQAMSNVGGGAAQ